MPQLRKMKMLLVWASFCEVSTPQPKYSNRQLGVEQVAARLGKMSEVRKVALKSYESRRLMTVAYQGLMGQGEATESVLMTFHAPASKQFTVLSTSGSQLLRESVFQRAMNAEQTASADSAQRASALNLDNYTMRLIGREGLPAGESYVLEVAPKISSEFTSVAGSAANPGRRILACHVWVQALDFAVVRIQGKPAVNPSPWISDGEFTTDFHKVGDFYFPERTVSTSNLPLGLHAQLTIRYESFHILQEFPVHAVGRLTE